MPRETIECVSACRATTCSVIYISGAIEMRIKVVHSKIKILARFESAIILVKIEKKYIPSIWVIEVTYIAGHQSKPAIS